MEPSWLETRWARPFYLAWVFFLTLGLLQAVKLYLRRQQLLRVLRAFPGPTPHWLTGNHKLLQDGKLEKIEELVEKHPCAFPLWMGPFEVFFYICDPDYAKTFLSRTDPKSKYAYEFLIPSIGEGLLSLNGPKWFQHRSLLTPAFNFNILKSFIRVMAQSVNIMLGKWEKICGTQDTLVEVFADISLMSLDTLMKCTFSRETDCQINSTHDHYVKALSEGSEIVSNCLYSFLFRHDVIFKLSPAGRRLQKTSSTLHQYTEQIIQERRKDLKDEKEQGASEKGKYEDFLDIILSAQAENGNSFSDTDLHSEVNTFMVAGQDTVGGSLSWLLYHLAQNPGHQEKCRQEIRGILGDGSSITCVWCPGNEDLIADLHLEPEWQGSSGAPLLGDLMIRHFSLDYGGCIYNFKSDLSHSYLAYVQCENKEIFVRDQLGEMSYTTMCIKESLRLIPTVISVTRELSKPISFPDGRSLPAGMTVVLNIWGLHRNPAVWENPKVFDPLRFSQENCDKRHSHSYLPFSAGPRDCIGQHFAMAELKVAVALILLRFRVTPDPTRPLCLSPQPLLKPKNGVHLYLKNIS